MVSDPTVTVETWQLWLNRAGFALIAVLAAETLWWLGFMLLHSRRKSA